MTLFISDFYFEITSTVTMQATVTMQLLTAIGSNDVLWKG